MHYQSGRRLLANTALRHNLIPEAEAEECDGIDVCITTALASFCN
jgi:hypothetical protein